MSLTLPLSQTLHLPSRAVNRAVSAAQTALSSVGTSEAPQGCMNSTEILRGQKAVEIRHNGSTYRLQATRLGKLILTK